MPNSNNRVYRKLIGDVPRVGDIVETRHGNGDAHCKAPVLGKVDKVWAQGKYFNMTIINQDQHSCNYRRPRKLGTLTRDTGTFWEVRIVEYGE